MIFFNLLPLILKFGKGLIDETEHIKSAVQMAWVVHFHDGVASFKQRAEHINYSRSKLITPCKVFIFIAI